MIDDPRTRPRPDETLDPTRAAIRIAFLQAVSRDRAAGAERTLAEYEERFAGFEDVVAEEYAALNDGPETDLEDRPVIDRYRLLRRIGEGGMGTVYFAEQTEPVRRPVALKLIKLGMDTRAVVRRFEAERQALALMDHPQIAHVLDAGASEDGRPYFVMEYVDGTPLTTFCDERRLDLRSRLELFAQTCRGVHHAHQKGILHRDLKPSNVLVTTIDGEPAPKIIDFGLAKAMHPDALEMSLVTVPGQFVGTLEYMSPEQASGSEDVDTRSDVYSLGVVLFELLTGGLPFPSGTLRAGSASTAAGEGVRPDAPVPSSRLAAAALADVAARRGLDARALRRAVRGDLDGIVLKALENDRDRRYESAAALAEDVQRYLDDEPVRAARPTTAYRLAKFVRRYRVLVSAFVLAFLVLLAGIVSTAVFAVGESRARAKISRQLASSNIERGRALGKAGSFLEAEDVIWREHLRDPGRQSYWALWELYFENRCRRTVHAHDPAPADSELDVADVAFRSDGGLLATLGNDGVIALRDPGSLREVARLAGRPLRCMAFSRDGRLLAAGGADGSLVVWDVASDRRRDLGRRASSVRALDFHPDGELLAVGGAAGVEVWNVTDGRREATLDDGTVQTLRFSPDGRTLATAKLSTVALWRDLSSPPFATLEGHPGGVQCLAFTPDGGTLLSGDSRWELATWDVGTGELKRLENTGSGEPRSLWVTPDGREFVYTGPWKIEVREFPSREVLRSISIPHARSAASPDGRLLATIDAGGVLRAWERGLLGASDLAGTYHDVLAVSPGGRLAASGSRDGTVRILGVRRSRILATCEGNGSRVRALAFGARGRHLAAATDDGTVRAWDLEDGALVRALDGYLCPFAGARSLGFHPERRMLAYAGAEGVVHVVDLSSGDRRAKLRVPDKVIGLAFHPVDGRLAVAAGDRTTTLWSVTGDEPRLVATFRHAGPPVSLDFSEDGRFYACGTDTHEVEIWSVPEQRRIHRLRGHYATVWTLAFRPGDPGLLASSGPDATIRLWDVERGATLAELVGGGVPQRLMFGVRGRTLLMSPGENIVLHLDHYDRHIASNLDYQIARHRDDLGDEMDEARVRAFPRNALLGDDSAVGDAAIGVDPAVVEAWGNR